MSTKITHEQVEEYVKDILLSCGSDYPYMKGTQFQLTVHKNKKDPEGVSMTSQELLYKCKLTVPNAYYLSGSNLQIKGQGGTLSDCIDDMMNKINNSKDLPKDLFPQREEDNQLRLFGEGNNDDSNNNDYTEIVTSDNGKIRPVNSKKEEVS